MTVAPSRNVVARGTGAGPGLPPPRGRLSRAVLERLAADSRNQPWPVPHVEPDEALSDDDLQLALYLCYELHYRGFDKVDDNFEWDPEILQFRRKLEGIFVEGLRGLVGPCGKQEDMAAELRAIASTDGGPSLSEHLATRGSLDNYREFAMHRSAYQLKEADPHTWAVPRLTGVPKSALVRIQYEEYGDGDATRMHSRLFAGALEELGLDSAYGAYLPDLPGTTLATVNLMSMFGLHRRWRGAIVGHLTVFEMTSTQPNRRYGDGLRRLGLPASATYFYDEHVEADAIHEQLALEQLAGALARAEPALAGDILFGGRCLVALEAQFGSHLIGAWEQGRSSLYRG